MTNSIYEILRVCDNLDVTVLLFLFIIILYVVFFYYYYLFYYLFFIFEAITRPTPTRPRPRCYSNEWQCNSGECIPMSALCDARSDCRDDSDEDNCRKLLIAE